MNFKVFSLIGMFFNILKYAKVNLKYLCCGLLDKNVNADKTESYITLQHVKKHVLLVTACCLCVFTGAISDHQLALKLYVRQALIGYNNTSKKFSIKGLGAGYKIDCTFDSS